MMAKKTKALMSLLAVSALLGGCAPMTSPSAQESLFSPSLDGIFPSQNLSPGMPLPDGAEIERPGQYPATPPATDELEGSLRPDSRSPEERIPSIYERGRIIVGIDQAQNRLSFSEPVTGELVGFEIDLAKEIAADIFGSTDAVEFRFVDSAQRIPALNRGDIDMIIRTMSITQERQEMVQFSSPYLTTATRMLVPTDSEIAQYEDLNGDTVCTTHGSTGRERARVLAPESTLMAVPRWSDCLYGLQQHQVDAIITDDVILAGISDQDPFTHIVGDSSATEVYGVGIRHPDSADEENIKEEARGLVRQVNETLERMRADGTWNEIYQAWFGNTPGLLHTEQPAPHYRSEVEDD